MSADAGSDRAVWPFWEPRLARVNKDTAQTWVQFTCPFDGWASTKVRPEVKGTFVGICAEAQQHLDAEHGGRWKP